MIIFTNRQKCIISENVNFKPIKEVNVVEKTSYHCFTYIFVLIVSYHMFELYKLN